MTVSATYKVKSSGAVVTVSRAQAMLAVISQVTGKRLTASGLGLVAK